MALLVYSVYITVQLVLHFGEGVTCGSAVRLGALSPSRAVSRSLLYCVPISFVLDIIANYFFLLISSLSFRCRFSSRL